MVCVAQLARALDCGSRGREFEAHHSPNTEGITANPFYTKILWNAPSEFGPLTQFGQSVSLTWRKS